MANTFILLFVLYRGYESDFTKTRAGPKQRRKTLLLCRRGIQLFESGCGSFGYGQHLRFPVLFESGCGLLGYGQHLRFLVPFASRHSDGDCPLFVSKDAGKGYARNLYRSVPGGIRCWNGDNAFFGHSLLICTQPAPIREGDIHHGFF